MESEDKLKFKAISLTKKGLEDKFQISLSDEEWKFFKHHASKSWEDGAEELRLFVFRHIRDALSEIGFKPTLKGKDIAFEKRD